MKELNDDELQKLLDNSLNQANLPVAQEQQNEWQAYQLVFEALKQEPVKGLPYHFSAGVMRRVKAQTERAQSRGLYGLLALLVMFSTILAFVMLYYARTPLASQLAYAISPYKWAIVFAALGLIAVQYLDWKLVKEKQVG
ncbi:hypothetical protein ABDD95_05595 [Mucilaginibacter sp. PAMB04274]|uniref:hypothetical protein n=1 Tax=Mucilaginibacter sp. PAMB04274 TaxID=3138568 RepID=UPI0031F6CF1F